MPGVADAERRTKNVQKLRGRKYDRKNLLKLINEGRIHEADAYQVEQIKLALELSDLLGTQAPSTPQLDPEILGDLLRKAVAEVVAALPKASSMSGPTGSAVADPARPKMKHVSMTDISHKESELSISHGETLATESEGEEDAGAKLKRLRELKKSS